MLETRLEMQRAKLESMSRARTKREDEQAAVPDAAAAGMSPIDLVDALPSMEAAEPLTV